MKTRMKSKSKGTIKTVKLSANDYHQNKKITDDILDSISDGVYALNADGYFTYVNKVITGRSGIPAERFYESHFLDIIDPECHDRAKKNFQIVMNGEDGIPYELKYKDAKMQVQIIEVHSRPVREGGKVVGLLGISRNISERKRSEEALREGEQLFRTLTERSLFGIYVVQDGLFESLNPNAASYAGYSPEDLMGKQSNSIVHPEDREIQRQGAIEMLKGKRTAPCEFRIIGKNGEIHWIMERVTPIIYRGRPAILGNSMDITEHKRMDHVLEKSEKELETKTHELEDLNSALRVLMKQREEDRNELEQKVMSNIKVLIMPHIEKLKTHVDMKAMSYVNVLESNLKDIVSPFAQKLSARYINLTKRELQIADLIKEGKTSREIASFLNISGSAVNVYRYHIRHKLNLTKQHNLSSYLSSLS